MKKHILILSGALGLSAIIVIAQDAGSGRPAGGPPGDRPALGGLGGQDGQGRGGRGPGGRGQRPIPPLMAALDVNKDGKLDATEIANASKALLTLDKNGDGELTPDELFGPRPGGNRPDGNRPGPGDGQRPPPPEQ